MMRPGAVALGTLLLLAALLGAPPRASAAANQLLDPAVGPTSGSVVTPFTFRVRYEGSFPALGVTTSVAGLTLPMLRTAGTASAGTWTVATALPSGTWRPTFTAVVAQGNQPTLVGPAVVVAAPAATADPTDAPPDVVPAPGGTTPTASGRTAPVEDAVAPTTTPPPAAPVAPSEAAAPAAPTPPPAVGSPAAVPRTAPSGGGAGPAAAPAAGSDGGDAPGGLPTSAPPSSRPGGGTVSAAPASSGSRTPRGSDDAEHGIRSALGDGGDAASEVTGVLVVGLSGVAAVALVGLAVLLARRRRERADAVQAVVAVDPGMQEGPRRRSRASSVELPDDPIVAAMGLGRDATTPRKRRDRAPD
jgi:hypothetical protein